MAAGTKREKGNSLLANIQDYTVIDIETTGLVTEYDEIIEVSAVKVKKGQIEDIYSTLVKSEPRLIYDYRTQDFITSYVPEFISLLTGITNEMLSEAPSAKEVLPNFIDFIGNDTLLGHNINFDINFLYDKCLKHGLGKLQNDYIDTMRLARIICKDIDHHRLSDLKQYFNIDINTEHRAEYDCITTNEVYKRLIQKTITDYGSFEEFLKSRKKKAASYKKFDIASIVCTADEIDESNYFYGKEVVFTGALEQMARKDAMQIVVNLGATLGKGINKKTNILIVGSTEHIGLLKGEKSNKLKKAEDMILSGADLTIIPEQAFYDLIGE